MSVRRALFVTRKFPPSVGGMETLAEQTHRALQEHVETILLSLGRSQRHLIWFAPFALLRTFLLLLGARVQHVICGDALMFTLLRPALLVHPPKTTVMVMGLDLTYPNALYRRAARATLRRADRVVAISGATAREAERLGVRPSRLAVLNPGLDIPPANDEKAAVRARLCERLELDPSSFLLLTLGRLIERKGVDWFIGHVLPQLPPQAFYLVAGTGPSITAIDAAIEKANIGGRVRLLGSSDHARRELLLRGADLFVMPNVPVPGDMEGFGLVAIEAALRGTPVVASRLEGITDAVVEGRTGYLCQPREAAEFVHRIEQLMSDRDELASMSGQVRNEAERRFSFERMVEELPRAFDLDGEV